MGGGDERGGAVIGVEDLNQTIPPLYFARNRSKCFPRPSHA